MYKIILHTGDIEYITIDNIEVLGDLRLTEQEMSYIGYNLSSREGIDINVFSNSEHIFNGLRIAILENKIMYDEVMVVSYSDDNDHNPLYLYFNKFANIVGTNNKIFSQSMDDISKILTLQSKLHRKI